MPDRIEDVIQKRGFIVTNTKGTSMYPLIKSKCDNVCIVRADSINIYDVPLYKRKNGDYVLHRILGKNDNGYILCGDNQWVLEYNVTEDMILGKLDAWYVGEKEYTVRDKRYKRYVKFWCKSLKLRRFMLLVLSLKWRTKHLCYLIYKKVFRK
jgi:hypothetical protein